MSKSIKKRPRKNEDTVQINLSKQHQQQISFIDEKISTNFAFRISYVYFGLYYKHITVINRSIKEYGEGK